MTSTPQATTAVQIVYHDVPAEVSKVSAYEWRPGSRPAAVAQTMTRQGTGMTVMAASRGQMFVVLQRADGAYLVDGPLAEGGDDGVGRVLDRVWRRTVSGTSSGVAATAPAIGWLAESGASGEAWPQCWWTSATAWECMGVPLESAGVAVAAGEVVLAAPVAHGSTPVLRASRWGRLVIALDRGAGPPAGLRVSAARPVTPKATRVRTIRVEAAALGDVHVTQIAPGVAWIAGDSSPPAAWLELRGSRDGPAYLALEEFAAGPPMVAERVALDAGRGVDAVVVSTREEPASAALVTTYRLIDPMPRRDSREPPPRRVVVAETVADAGGGVRIDGLGDADYEVVAWHPAFGRASMLLPAGAGRVTIRVLSPGIARGRVLAGGKPAAGVDVISMPDPAAYAAAVDPIDVKGGDARSGPDGRFMLALAPGGGGELRVGGGAYAIRRLPLPRAPLPIVELGDIEVGRSIAVSVVLDQDPGCDVRATGPVGRSGLQIVTATRTGPGLFAMTLPEEGSWEFVLMCGRQERAVTPAIVKVTAAGVGQEVRLAVR